MEEIGFNGRNLIPYTLFFAKQGVLVISGECWTDPRILFQWKSMQACGVVDLDREVILVDFWLTATSFGDWDGDWGLAIIEGEIIVG